MNCSPRLKEVIKGSKAGVVLSALICTSSVQSLSRVRLSATPGTVCSTPGLPVHHQLPELAQTHVH